MGITIHHRLKHNKIYVKDTLDRAEQLARTLKKEQADKLSVPFTIRRPNDFTLYVDIGGCETLSFAFKSKAELEADASRGWAYTHAVLTNDGKEPLDEGYEIAKYPQNEIYFCASFCKTQYASTILEHYWVAEIIRKVASYCTYAEIGDEGDYYHSGKLEDASESIESLGKMINGLGAVLAGNFGAEKVIAGGKTIIKTNKRKNAKQ